MGKQLLSHRYNLLPLLCSHPGGVQRELIVKDLPGTKVGKGRVLANKSSKKVDLVECEGVSGEGRLIVELVNWLTAAEKLVK